MMMMKPMLAMIFTLALAGNSPAAKAAEPGSPEVMVAEFVLQAYTAIALSGPARLIGEGSTLGFCQLTEKYIDLDTMIGPMQNGLDDGKKQKLRLSIKSFLIHQLSQTFTQNAGDLRQIQYTPVPGRTSVKVYVPEGKVTSLVHYRQLEDKSFRLIEVENDQGIRLASLNRSQFSAVLKREGLDSLVAKLNAKSQNGMGHCPD